MYETYQIFMDSGTGLLTGTLKLNHQDCSGMMEIYGNPLELSDVCFDGKERRFSGVLPLDNHRVDFTAKGELDDGVLDVMVQAEGKKLLMTGFLKEEHNQM